MRFSFLKHDNLMAHPVKAFWIVHYIVCACRIDRCFHCSQCWHSCGMLVTGLKTLCFSWWNDDGIFNATLVPSLSHMFVLGNPGWVFYHWDCPGIRVFANFSLPDWHVIAYQWSCWTRHDWQMSSGGVQLAADSMWNAGMVWLLLSAMSTCVDGSKLPGSCLSCSIRRWMMAVHVKAMLGLPPCISWWLPFRVFRVDRKSSFHCCLLVSVESGKHLSGIKRFLNTTMNDALWTWMRMWTYSAYNDTACGRRLRIVYAVSTEDVFHAYGKG